MPSVEVLIAVCDDHTDKIPIIVEKFKSLGITDIRLMSTIGIITCLVEESKISEISLIEGVSCVERSQTFCLPPPDSPVQ